MLIYQTNIGIKHQKSQLLVLASVTPIVKVFGTNQAFNLKNIWTYSDLIVGKTLKNLDIQPSWSFKNTIPSQN
jgi:hypothetical protein